MHNSLWSTIQNLASPPLPLFGKEGPGEICCALAAPVVTKESPYALKETSPPSNQIPLDPPFPKGESITANHLPPHSRVQPKRCVAWLALKKGDRGRFEFEFSRCHCLEFLNELLKRRPRIAGRPAHDSTSPIGFFSFLGSSRWSAENP